MFGRVGGWLLSDRSLCVVIVLRAARLLENHLVDHALELLVGLLHLLSLDPIRLLDHRSDLAQHGRFSRLLRPIEANVLL